MEAGRVRQMWHLLEPLHALLYYAPEAFDEAAALGYDTTERWPSYFAWRAAPLGPAGPDRVADTFYSFSPAMIARYVPAAWDTAAPADVLAARVRAVDRTYRAVLGEELLASPELAEAAELARTAATRRARPPTYRSAAPPRTATKVTSPPSPATSPRPSSRTKRKRPESAAAQGVAHSRASSSRAHNCTSAAPSPSRPAAGEATMLRTRSCVGEGSRPAPASSSASRAPQSSASPRSSALPREVMLIRPSPRVSAATARTST